MSSRSFINLCSALTLSRFCAEIVLKDIPDNLSNRKIRRIASSIIDHVMTTRGLWTEPTTAEDLAQITGRIEHLGDEILHGDRTMTELVAVALGMLVDMEPRLRGEKRASVDRLIELMEAMNREFDRSLEDHLAYEYAGNAVERWYAVVGL